MRAGALQTHRRSGVLRLVAELSRTGAFSIHFLKLLLVALDRIVRRYALCLASRAKEHHKWRSDELPS
jgi:hypothetical protein